MESRLHCLVWHKDHRSERCDTRISSPIRLHADFGLRCHCIETSRPMLRCSVCTTQKMLWVWSKRKSTNPSFRNAWRWTNWRVPPTECLFLNQAPPRLPSWLCWLRKKSFNESQVSAAFWTFCRLWDASNELTECLLEPSHLYHLSIFGRSAAPTLNKPFEKPIRLWFSLLSSHSPWCAARDMIQ